MDRRTAPGAPVGRGSVGLFGGEPLLRDDLEELVAEGRQLGFYTNLITSGIGLTEARLARLKAAGLDHIQLSFQDSTREMNDFLSNTRTFDLKSRIALLIKQYDYPMVLNVVLHRHNLDHVERIIEMAVAMGVEYLELANTQYYGWGLINRAQLMPTREQLQRAEAVVNAYRGKLGNRLRILFVVPDYFESRPKACMSGWGRCSWLLRQMVPPCHAMRRRPFLACAFLMSQICRLLKSGIKARRSTTSVVMPGCRSPVAPARKSIRISVAVAARHLRSQAMRHRLILCAISRPITAGCKRSCCMPGTRSKAP